MDIQREVFSRIAGLAEPPGKTIDTNTALIGDGSILDSMKLVELCLQLEDLATELGFGFDWTSEAAMSRSRSMFRTAGSLAEAFMEQQKAQA